jgi:ATP-dependent Zn protease
MTLALFFAALGALGILGLVVAVLIRRRANGGPDEPLTLRVPEAARIDTRDCRMAVHEAGHAAAAWCCTAVSEVSSARIDAKNGGEVEYLFYGGARTAEHAWCGLVITLSGIAAEGLVYSRWKTRNQLTFEGGDGYLLSKEKDLAAALTLAEDILSLSGACPWPRDEAMARLSPDPRKIYKKISNEAADVWQESYWMSKSLLRAHGASFFELVSLLLAKRKASSSDLEIVLGKRRVALLAAMGSWIESVVREEGKPKLLLPKFLLPQKRKKAA